MYDDKGEPIKKAGPSIPVEILGLPEVPDAGESIYAVKDEKMARQLVEKRKIKQREEHIRKSSRMSLETLAAQMAEGNIKDLNIIVKADIQGSVEAVTQSFEKLSNDEVRVKVIHGAVGAINESDIVLADVSNAVIIGFNVRPNAIITEKAKEAGVEIKLYDVIYKATEDIEKAMKGMLEPTFEEVVLGHAEIRELFKVSGVGTIGGCYVTDGKIIRNCGVRILRNDIVIHTGELASLQRLKDSVKEVNSGFECGLSVANYNDIKVGDVIEAFTSQEVDRDA
jgi:translation initiation factor IF-2